MKHFRIWKFWALCLTLVFVLGCASDVKVTEEEGEGNEVASSEPVDAEALNTEEGAVPELASEEATESAEVASEEVSQAEQVANNVQQAHKAARKKDALFIDKLLAENSDKNRYYVVRPGDTPQRVAVMIYNDPRQASQLVHWNGAETEWYVGRVIYYTSPKNPADKRMISFYEENNIASKKVTVQPGETLESLAEMHLGSRASSRELALLNGLKDAVEVEPGRILDIYPVLNSSDKSEGTRELAQSLQKDKPVSDKPVSDVQAMMAAKAQVVPVPLAPPAMEPPKPEVKPKASFASTVVASVHGHQGIIFGCALVVAGIFAAYYFMQRKNRNDFDL